MLTSLHTRILLTTVAVILPVMLLYSFLSQQHVHYQLSQRFDGRMNGEMRMLQAAVTRSGGDLKRIVEMIELMPVDSYPRRRHLAIWNGTEIVLATDRQPFSSPPPGAPGFHQVDSRDGEWRVLSAVMPPSAATRGHPWLLTVADSMRTRERLISGAAMDILLPLLVAVPIVILGIYVALATGLRPLRRLAEQIRRRSAERLQPLHDGDVPNELKSIAESVNQLMSRLGDSLDRERRFTADAAHELRTPLTALKAHAQVALRATDEQLRQDTLRNITRTVTRTDRIITQLLTLARLDPDAGQTYIGKVDLGRIASHTLAELRSLAEARRQQLNLHADPNVVVRGNSDALAILTRNIVENAIQYSDEGTPIDIRVFGNAGQGVLEVDDRGPGIPDGEKQEVLRRFRRIPGTKGSGIGLGLSIVQRIVELHGGQVALSDVESGTGLRVRATLPAAVD